MVKPSAPEALARLAAKRKTPAPVVKPLKVRGPSRARPRRT